MKLRSAFFLLLVFECVGPLLETAGYAFIVAAGLGGLVSPQACAAFFSIAIGMGILLSVSGLLLDAMSFRTSRRIDVPGRLILAAIAENLGYRQLNAYRRSLGAIAWWRSRRAPQGDIAD
jgi:hypothetical protein